MRGRVVHGDIGQSSAVGHELTAGWIFHYVTGGSVALTYPVLYLTFQLWRLADHLVAALLWGLGTTLLPWMILYPALGWGFFGVRAPKGTRPILAASMAHLLYGLGVGVVLSMAAPPFGIASIGSR